VVDNWAYNKIGSGNGGVNLNEYSDRCRELKVEADAYVDKFGQKQGALTDSHQDSLLMLFSNSKVSQSLFIGYLVNGVVAHDVDWYPSVFWAHFGIQFRTVVAVLGVATLVLEGAVDGQVRMINSLPGYSKLDGRGIRQNKQVAWVFLRKVNFLRLITRFVGSLVLLTFALGFLLDVWTKFRHDLDLSATYITVFAIVGVVVLLTYWVRSEGAEAVATMGYRIGDCGFRAEGPLQDNITYTSGLPGKDNAARSRHRNAHHSFI